MSLKLEKLSKRINDNWILRDFSLEVNSGEIFGLLGATGCGKTKLLQIIAGKDKPDSGSIQPIENVRFLGDRKEISAWKQIFGSVKSEISSNGEITFSEFEQTLNEAENILLIDDSFRLFDENLREQAFSKLREIAKDKQLAVIFATNNIEDAFSVCDRIGVLFKGEIVQTGTPRELYENPDSVAVASAIGRNNLIVARRVTFNNQLIPEFQTLVGDHRLQTGKADKAKLGTITQNVTLAIRPEHISISFGASFPEDNLLKAKIVEIRYAGATTRVKLDANSLILEALVLRLVGLNKGDECLVGLPPDRILILKG